MAIWKVITATIFFLLFADLFNSVNPKSLDNLTSDNKNAGNTTFSKKIQIRTNNVGEMVVVYGVCGAEDQILHTEAIHIENEGSSTLSGIFEFFLDMPAKVTCVEIQDTGEEGSKSAPLLFDGGPGYDWLKVKVKGKYGKGIFVLVKAFGIPDIDALSKQSSNNEI